MFVSSEELKIGLENLEMYQDSNLFYTHQINEVEDYSIRFSLENALKYKADAVYFRYISTYKKYIPQIYIYDFTRDISENLDKEITQIHKKLWNNGQVPIFFVFTKTEVKIFNCLKSPTISGKEFISKPIEIVSVLSKVDKSIKKKNFQNFSASFFSNGTFWENSKYKNQFKINDSAYEKLLQHLKNCRKELKDKNIFESEELANKFILMSILIKYLEEREDEQGNKVFTADFFSKFDKSNNFEDVLRKGSLCLDLFDYLSKHFNGQVFEWNEAEKEILKNTNFNLIADFISAKIDSRGQMNLFSLYSFNDLPVELISNIYEEFSNKSDDKKGVVYTPPFLVNFLIDECMPIYNPQDTFKVLDPACGSGIFLVSAFKRLVEWWRIKNNFSEPDLEKLREILLNNIFGVDIESESVRVAIFSLSLAMCEFLSPKVIWDQLKFENLNDKNLFSQDFFQLIYDKKIKEKFDLVIGNPPFDQSLSDFGTKIEKLKPKDEIKVPRNQIALLFLKQSINLCKKNGLLCFILPSGSILYNSSSHNFRKSFFEKYNVPQIIDFSYLQNILFGENGKIAVSALFVKNEEMKKNDLLHIVVKRTKSSKEKLYFELDHYDFNYIRRDIAINNKFVWKCNLLGGGRILNIISKFAESRTLDEYLQEKILNNSWFVCEGFQINKKPTKEANFLTNKLSLPTDAFTKNGIDKEQLFILEQKYFSVPRKEWIFKKPHLLIKEIIEENVIPIEFVDYDVSFKKQIIGIHAPEEQIEDLINIESWIKNNRSLVFYMLCTSGRILISRSTSIIKNDIDNIPYPENINDLELSELENIIIDDTINYITEFFRSGENSKILKETDKNDLENFGDIYCSILNSVYKDEKKEFKVLNFEQKSNFVIYSFYYGTEKPKVNFDYVKNDINTLIENNVHTNLKINRVLRFYDENTIYIIKPNQKRYWLKSIAIRDADETFLDLYKQGY